MRKTGHSRNGPLIRARLGESLNIDRAHLKESDIQLFFLGEKWEDIQLRGS